MAFMRNREGDEVVIDCTCGCNDGIRIKINKYDEDDYCIASYVNGNFYRDQSTGFWSCLGKKIKKMWRIFWNKDFYYSEIIMTKKDFEEFRNYIDSIE